MKLKELIYGMIAAVVLLPACDEIEEGYLSDNVHYADDPFTVEKGTTTYSQALKGDNSTVPLTVELLDIRNVQTGKTEKSWSEMQSITIWKEAVDVNVDTTYEQILAKLDTASYLPFRVNPSGGRLEFTAGTTTVPTGEYEIDVKVSNVRGSLTLKNACLIKLTEPTSFYEPAGSGYYDVWNPYGKDMNTPVLTYTEVKDEKKIAAFKAKLEEYGYPYDEEYGYMILKVIDHYGNTFSWKGGTDPEDPNAGEILQRRDYTRSSYETRAPWETMIYTDESLIARFGLAPFPIINGPGNNGISYYRIPAKYVNLGIDIQVRFSWRITRKGIFEVTYRLKGTDETNMVKRIS